MKRNHNLCPRWRCPLLSGFQATPKFSAEQTHIRHHGNNGAPGPPNPGQASCQPCPVPGLAWELGAGGHRGYHGWGAGDPLSLAPLSSRCLMGSSWGGGEWPGPPPPSDVSSPTLHLFIRDALPESMPLAPGTPPTGAGE